MKKYPLSEHEDGYIDFRAWKKGKIFSELRKLGYSAPEFVEQFQTSPIADLWDRDELSGYIGWSPVAAAQNFVLDLAEDCGVTLEPMTAHKESVPGEGETGTEEDMFISPPEPEPEALDWIGQVYEMLSAYTGKSSRDVYKEFGFADMYDLWEEACPADPYGIAVNIAESARMTKKEEQTNGKEL